MILSGASKEKRNERKRMGVDLLPSIQTRTQTRLVSQSTPCKSFFFHTSIMLTLDPTTLFYWSCSDPPPKRMKFSVESWVKANSSNAASRTMSQANSVRSGKTSTRTGTAPALMSSWSQAASSASVTTSSISITNTQVPKAVKIKQDKNVIYSYDGALSDNEKITGVEHNAAHASPIKGKKRLNSKVSAHYDMNGCI